MKKILVLILLGVITILTPLSFKANYYSIDQPVIDLNNYTLNEVFIDTINDLDQYIIETDILDLQAYEGLSLRDIFESGNLVVNSDFSNGTTGWSKSLNTTNFAVINGIMQFERTGSDSYVLQAISLSVDNYYIAYYSKSNSNTFNLNLSGLSALYNSGSNNFELKTSIANVVSPLTTVRLQTSEIGLNYIDWIKLIPLSIFTTAPSQLQLDEWLSFYLDPSTIASFDMVGDIEVYRVGDTFYNLTEMINDKVYSTFNLDTFDNLTDGEITDQFGAWQTLGIEDIEVLSLTEFQTFAPALDQEDMLYWYNYYNLILEYDKVQAGILSDLEITILIIALVLFIIGIALAIYFHHKIMFFVTGLLWFVPIVIVPNIFIITFSVIMIIIFGLLAFYNSQGKDFD